MTASYLFWLTVTKTSALFLSPSPHFFPFIFWITQVLLVVCFPHGISIKLP